jgi:hypothetical protein
MRFCSELQTARRNRRQCLGLTDDRGKGTAAQRFLHRPQRIPHLARVGDDETRRVESTGNEAGAVKRAGFASDVLWRAPQGEAAPVGEQSGERDAKTACRRVALDLMQAGAR